MTLAIAETIWLTVKRKSDYRSASDPDEMFIDLFLQ